MSKFLKAMAGRIAWSGLLCLAGAPRADAAILAIDATVATAAREMIDGGPGSFTEDGAVLGEDGAAFPLGAVSSLISSDVDGNVRSFGESIVELRDPALSTDENPAEFGLEVSAFSNSEAIAYAMEGAARQTRSVVFSSDASIDPNPIAFNADGTREIESRLFLQGAMIAWSLDESVSVDDLIGYLSVRVTRDDTEEVLFESEVELDADGFAAAMATVTGSVEVRVGGVELLAAGASDEVRDALRTLDAAGTVVVVLLPAQSQAYRYTVSDGESLELTATFESEAINVPGGSGVAVAWGRPFERLASLIDQALPGVEGRRIEAAINKAVAAPVGAASRGSLPLCGSVGGGGALGLLMPMFVRRRVRNPLRRYAP